MVIPLRTSLLVLSSIQEIRNSSVKEHFKRISPTLSSRVEGLVLTPVKEDRKYLVAQQPSTEFKAEVRLVHWDCRILDLILFYLDSPSLWTREH